MLLISNSSKYIKAGLLIVLGALATLFYFFNPEEQELFPKCIFHSVTGYHCPGCGSQRAIHSLLHLDIAGVISNNILFIPAVLSIIYGLLLPEINKVFHKNYSNLMYHPKTPLIIFAVIILFWILRNLPIFPFTILVPG